MTRETYLVRHGAYHRDGPRELRGTLTESGIEQAREAGQTLKAWLLGNGAVILSSDAPRALQTAQIIGAELGVEAQASKIMRLAGENPEQVPSLRAVLIKAMEKLGINPNGSHSLVVVNHEPLLATATDRDSVAHGEVIDYTHGNWHNPACQDGGSAWKNTLHEHGLA